MDRDRQNMLGAIDAAGHAGACLSLLFAKGTRPHAQHVVALCERNSFEICDRPLGSQGWLELLADGLTFRLTGLTPARPAPPAPRRHTFGLDGPELPAGLETICLTPGTHLPSGPALLPVVRAITGVAAALATIPGIRAVCWHPARSCIETALFVRMIDAWLANGVFPALGLTALTHEADGAVRSEGLAFFIGQELWLEARWDETSAETTALAVRLIHNLVEEGGLHSPAELIAPDGSRLDAELSLDGSVLRVWRRNHVAASARLS